MTKMNEVLKKIGVVSFKSKFTKDEFKYIEKVLVADNMVRIIKRGQGKPMLIEPTAKAKMILGM